MRQCNLIPHPRQLWLLLLALMVAAMLFSQPSRAAETSKTYSDAELAQMLAPIALYPDALLSHILIASSYPLEVVEAQRWRANHSSWDNDRLMNEAANQGWDPSVIALLAFPNVLDKMSQDLSWTVSLGEAFTADEGRVMDNIQSLRQAAYDADNLKDVSHIQAQKEQDRIVIVPSDPQVIWVPYYDPRVVYGPWRWYSYPPVYWDPFPGYVVAPSGLFYWRTGGVQISFNFFFSYFHWHDRVVWVDYRNRHPRYVPYRSSVSHGTQRWEHRPEHRRGVQYRNADLRSRYAHDVPRRDKDDNRFREVQHSLQQSPEERRQHRADGDRNNRPDSAKEHDGKNLAADNRDTQRTGQPYSRPQSSVAEQQSRSMPQDQRDSRQDKSQSAARQNSAEHPEPNRNISDSRNSGRENSSVNNDRSTLQSQRQPSQRETPSVRETKTDNTRQMELKSAESRQAQRPTSVRQETQRPVAEPRREESNVRQQTKLNDRQAAAVKVDNSRTSPRAAPQAEARSFQNSTPRNHSDNTSRQKER